GAAAAALACSRLARRPALARRRRAAPSVTSRKVRGAIRRGDARISVDLLHDLAPHAVAIPNHVAVVHGLHLIRLYFARSLVVADGKAEILSFADPCNGASKILSDTVFAAHSPKYLVGLYPSLDVRQGQLRI